MDLLNIIQELGKRNSELVVWFGDYAMYEKRIGVTDKQIIDEYKKYIKEE